MSKFIDLTGEIFGRLLVIEIEDRYAKDKKWLCKCECGKYVAVYAGHLKSGASSSCGCYNREVASKREVIDLTGKVFGRFKVLKRCEDRYDKIGNVIPFWLCECECGNLIEVNGGSLRKRLSTSCGCYRRENISNIKLIDIVGNKYGRLTVLSIDHKTNIRVYWLCECTCGRRCVVMGINLRNGHTKSCGCLSESWVASELKGYFSEKYGAQKEYKILRNPKTNNFLPYDIYIACGENPEINGVYIEVNDEQHYKFIPRWHRTEERFKDSRKRDKLKRKFAKRNGMYIEIDLRKIKDVLGAIGYVEEKLPKEVNIYE